MKQELDELILVARLGKTVGLKGFVKLHIISDFTNQFKPNSSYFDSNLKKLTIKELNKANQTVQFFGYESVDSAKELVNIELFDTKENTKKRFKLKDGEFFYFDIIGKKIYENGCELGLVVDILDNFSQFLFKVKTNSSLVEAGFSKFFYIPYVDRYIVDINEHIVTVNAKDILENS